MSDVRGYTTIAEHADPSLLAGQLNEHRAAMNRAILSNDGTVMQFVGDAVMAVFGAPVAQENHADLAVAAAQAMHVAQRELNERWVPEGRSPFGLGIGLSTGLVAAALLGSEERLEYTVVGDTVNLTQRIQQWAEPGETVLSEPTWEALTVRPEADVLPPEIVKGRQTPVSAHRFPRRARVNLWALRQAHASRVGVAFGAVSAGIVLWSSMVALVAVGRLELPHRDLGSRVRFHGLGFWRADDGDDQVSAEQRRRCGPSHGRGSLRPCTCARPLREALLFAGARLSRLTYDVLRGISALPSFPGPRRSPFTSASGPCFPAIWLPLTAGIAAVPRWQAPLSNRWKWVGWWSVLAMAVGAVAAAVSGTIPGAPFPSGLRNQPQPVSSDPS